jgi:hypothetical protein
VLATPRTKRFCFGPGSSQSWFYPARGVTPSGLDSIHQTLKPRERSTLFALLGTARQGGRGPRKSAANRFTLIRDREPALGAMNACQPIISTASQPGTWRLPAPLASKTVPSKPRHFFDKPTSSEGPRTPMAERHNSKEERKVSCRCMPIQCFKWEFTP